VATAVTRVFPELDDIAVCERNVSELDARIPRQVPGGTGPLDKLRQAGDVISLHVRLEHRHDRRADPPPRVDVRLDQLDVRVEDSELALRGATEQIARAGRLLEQERP
jgi:hypothetical protein